MEPRKVEDLFNGGLLLKFKGPAFRDIQHRLDFWRLHREQLMEWWLSGLPESFDRWFGLSNFKPEMFTRPHAWWSYDAPERRRIVAIEELHWESRWMTRTERPPTPEEIAELWRESEESAAKFGGEAAPWGYPDAQGLFHVETEEDYLKRLGLLLPIELETLNA